MSEMSTLRGRVTPNQTRLQLSFHFGDWLICWDTKSQQEQTQPTQPFEIYRALQFVSTFLIFELCD